MDDAAATIGLPVNGNPPIPGLLLNMQGIAKAFGPTQALRRADFQLRPGEIHVLVGENGSGKSTLVKIISGVHSPDVGSIEVGGESITAIRTPRAARSLGIATVFQEVLVAEARSVLENVCLGLDIRPRPSKKEKVALARTVLDELTDESLDLSTPVEDLSLSERQTCCIARALVRSPRILILDEATSALDVATRDRLFGVVRRLTGEGVGVIFITHRMDEISEIGERVTVMRSGETVATLTDGNWTTAELVRLMTGAERLAEHIRERPEASTASDGRLLLTGRALRLQPDKAAFDFDLHAGELVGLAGLEGQGQNRFLDVLRGLGGEGTGEVVRHTDHGEVEITSFEGAARAGVAFVPRERSHAIFRWMSIQRNFGMPTIDQDRRSGLLQPGATRRRLAGYVQQLKIVLGDADDRITTLSGGNQQKVIIARWLAAEPSVLLLNDPTRGIDIQAKRDLYALLDQMTKDGLAVVMLSSELDEHIELMDRVLVFREDELFTEIRHRSLSRQALVGAFFGDEGAAA